MKFIKLLLVFLIFITPVYAKETVDFIHITDTNLNKDNASAIYKTIKEINTYKNIDFVVFGGNNIAHADFDSLDAFMWLVKKLNKKTVVLMGSTDVVSSEGIDKKYYLRRAFFARKFRHSLKPNYVFKKNGCVFVVMDGAKQYMQSTNGYYNAKELHFLDKTLTKYKDKPVIILQHFPPVKSNSKWKETAKYEDYQEVLSKHSNVKMIVSGHYGSNLEFKQNGIYYIITESYNKNGAYKVIQYDVKDNFIGTYLVK